MRRFVPVIAVLASVVAACGGSGVDATTTRAGGAATTMLAVATAEAVGAATGGTVASNDGELMVEIPAGALAENTAISITRLDPEDWPESFADGTVVGDVYDLQPSGLTFAEPVTISHRITEAETGLDFDVEVPLTLLVIVSDDGTWEAPADQVITRDGEDLLHTGVIDHFSVTTLLGGLITVTFIPTDVEARVGEAFKASVVPDPELSPGESRWIEAGLLFAAPIASGAVEALSGEYETDSPEELETAWSGEYRCVTVGEGRYGVLIGVGEGATELFGTPDESLFYILQLGNLVQETVSTEVLTGTAVCTDKPFSISAYVTFQVTGDFFRTAGSPAVCGDTFTDTLVVEFGEDATGTIAWLGEPEGIPFTMTDNVLVAELVTPVEADPGTVTRDVFEIDIATGQITVAFEVIPPPRSSTRRRRPARRQRR